MKKRILSLVLSLVLTVCCFTALSITASAVAATYVSTTVYDADKLIEYGETKGYADLVLAANITIDETLDIKGEVTIDLNGYTIRRNLSSAKSNGQVIKVHEDAVLIIKDSVGGGMITGGNNTGGAGGIQIHEGTVKMYGGIICGNHSNEGGGGVRLVDGDKSRFEMYGGEIRNNTADNNGGGINIHEGYVVIEGGVIAENKSTDRGGAIYVNDSHGDNKETLIIKGATDEKVLIKNNSAYWGGGIFVNNGRVTIENAVFTENSATSNGGGIYCDDDDGTEILSCEFTKNHAQYGGAIYIYDDNVKLSNLTVTENTVLMRGAIYSVDNDFEIAGKMIVIDNKCNSSPSTANVFLHGESRIQLKENLEPDSGVHAETYDENSIIAECENDQIAEKSRRYFRRNNIDVASKGSIIMFARSRSYGSVFTQGSTWIIIGVGGVLVAAVITVVAVKKKKKAAVADGAEENREE